MSMDQHSEASQDEANYNQALEQSGPDENQEVREEDVGDDAIHDARMEEVRRNVDKTFNNELGEEEEDNVAAENYGEEVIGEDGITRVVDKSGLLLPKLSSHNLRLYGESTEQTAHDEKDKDEAGSHDAAVSSNASGGPNEPSSDQDKNNENNATEVEADDRNDETGQDTTEADGEKEQEEVPNGSRSVGSGNSVKENRKFLSEPENDDQQQKLPHLPGSVSAGSETKHAVTSKQKPATIFPTTLVPEKRVDEGINYKTAEKFGGLDRIEKVGFKKRNQTNTTTSFDENDDGDFDELGLGVSSHQAERRALSNVNLFKLLLKSDCSDDEKQIRSLVIKVGVSTLVLCLLYMGSFFITFQVMQQGSFTGSEVNQAERRIFLTSELVALAQELLIGDGELLETVKDTHDLTEQRIQLLRIVHEGIRFVNSSMNLPGTDRRGGIIDSLQYDRGYSAFNISNDPYGETLYSQGVSVGIRYLIQSVELILGEFGDASKVGEFGDPSSPRPGRNLTELETIGHFQFMKRLDRKHLRPGLMEAGSEFVDRGFSTLEGLRVYEILLFLADLLLYALLGATIYRTMSRELLDEGQRSEDVLLLIPAEVVEKTKKLHIFFKGNMDERDN